MTTYPLPYTDADLDAAWEAHLYADSDGEAETTAPAPEFVSEDLSDFVAAGMDPSA